jgi:predicted enzyme related to lactoylglutathione lyase
MKSFQVGSIGWIDLTVPDAENVRHFYEKVVGWESTPVEMGGYNDHCMLPPGTEAPVAGVCHARGPNAHIPAQWLIYIWVADLDTSLAKVVELGGQILDGPRGKAPNRFAIIRDPSGACCALGQVPNAKSES